MKIANYSKARKIILIAGVVICLVTLLVIYPYEYSKSSYLWEFVLTFAGLVTSILTILYGLTGGRFIKYLGFLLLSGVTGIFCWAIYPAPEYWWLRALAIWCGLPSGVIAALLFFMIRYYLFFRNRESPVDKTARSILFLKQLVLYVVLLLIVSILFLKGGDWIYDIFES